MGLFDKIKDNAKNISMKSLEDPDADFALPEHASVAEPSEEENFPTPEGVITPNNQDESDQPIEETSPEPVKEDKTETPESKPEPKPEPAVVPEKPKEEKPKEVKTSSSVNNTHQPYYKSTVVKVVDKSKVEDVRKPSSPARRSPHVIDITPQKIQDPVKKEMFARERAAMSALASQRKLNGSVALYATNHLNFKTRVFIDRIEYSGSFGKNVLPIETVAWVKLRAGGTGIIIETTNGKRVVMVVKPKDRLDFADSVMKVQELQPKRVKFKDTQTVRIDQLEQFTDDFEELEKLAKLRDRGIVTNEEFETKKKKILGI
jgi:hypothetical protein